MSRAIGSLGASAALGAAAWSFLLLAGPGAEPILGLDRFLLLAALVVVPLGLSLCERLSGSRIASMQPLAAAFAVAACAAGHGIVAGGLAIVWLLFAAAIAYAALRLARNRDRSRRRLPLLHRRHRLPRRRRRLVRRRASASSRSASAGLRR
jgi:hypothetical protein